MHWTTVLRVRYPPKVWNCDMNINFTFIFIHIQLEFRCRSIDLQSAYVAGNNIVIKSSTDYSHSNFLFKLLMHCVLQRSTITKTISTFGLFLLQQQILALEPPPPSSSAVVAVTIIIIFQSIDIVLIWYWHMSRTRKCVRTWKSEHLTITISCNWNWSKARGFHRKIL